MNTIQSLGNPIGIVDINAALCLKTNSGQEISIILNGTSLWWIKAEVFFGNQ